jgi:hypothetical protein
MRIEGERLRAFASLKVCRLRENAPATQFGGKIERLKR